MSDEFEQARILAAARDGKTYRLTIEAPNGSRRSGLVTAHVERPTITVRPGNVVFTLAGDLDKNEIYPGPMTDIVSLEEVDDGA